MKTRTFTMAALAAGVALMLSAQMQAQVVLPKVVFDTTGAAVNITIGTTSGDPDTTVPDKVTMNLLLLGTSVAGTQNDITVNGGGLGVPLTVPEGHICSVIVGGVNDGDGLPCETAADCAPQTCDAGACNLSGATCTTAADCAAQTCDPSGAPDCVVNPAIHKEATEFVYLPRSPSSSCCTTGSCPGTCTGIRGIVLSLKNTNAIPDGSTLYTCKIAIATTAGDNPTGYPLTVPPGSASASDPAGGPLETSSTDGAIIVPAIATPSATPTDTPLPADTPTITPPQPPTSTAVSTATPKPTHGGGGGNDDDSCAIVSPANSAAGWMLLLPAAALLWIRRRSR